MTAPAVAVDFFFNDKLLASRDPKTANVSPSAWVENLEMGIHTAIQLAKNLKSELDAGGPHKETMHALYFKVLTLSGAHPHGPTKPSYATAISEPLHQALQVTQSWYLGCIDPERADSARAQVCPTAVAVEELLKKLNAIIAIDEDGNRAIDLSATAQPFINHYNAGCKPAQVFTTPAELFEAGAPLAWMAGKK